MDEVNVMLSVYHDGQFYCALFEKTDTNGYSVAKRKFATKPLDAEILGAVLENYYELKFSTPSQSDNAVSKNIKNPKRRQREAAKALKTTGMSTKAQMALQQERERNKIESSRYSSNQRNQDKKMKFTLKVEKRKQKHKGH